jgi:putative flavoprotein involved in K+ transport
MNTVVIGGGQAGLSVGYHLRRLGVPFVILDASARIGDGWRLRWDSLRLFTPAAFCGLDGMPFPGPRHAFPTKDEIADFLERYARAFDLPVRSGVRVDRLSRCGSRFLVAAGDDRYVADHVVIAMANYQRPRIPAFAADLAPDIVQIHSCDYRNPSQLAEGGVLVVGAGNSGAEIAIETIRSHRTWVAGRDVGRVPFRVAGPLGRLILPFLFRVIFHRVFSVATPIGRRLRRKTLHGGGVLIRTNRRTLREAGVVCVPRVAGVEAGRPRLENGVVLDVANVIWCTGFHPGFSWVDLPVFDVHGDPRHESGIVRDEPGLYFVGLHFLSAFSSAMIHGVGRDAARVASAIAARVRAAGGRESSAA